MIEKKHIVVIGGGITGLTAAYYLQKQIDGKDLPWRITLLEKSDRFGGKIHTERVGDLLIERGADSFLARKLPIIQLIQDLGIENELVGTNPATRRNYILHRNRLHPMPPGLILGIPTKLTSFISTGLISPVGKLRAALDYILPPYIRKVMCL
jgi:oxygen-dependent protoporphyrinogen oxidase